jgi:transmembrane sensor
VEADEREFAAFASDQDPLDVEAATWVTRRRSGLDAQGEADLQAWLDADPRHPEALADMDATFGEVRQLPGDDVARLKTVLADRESVVQAIPPRAAQPRQRPAQTGSWGGVATGLLGLLRPLLPQASAAALALATLGTAWMGWDHWRQQPVFEQTYATQRGQQLTATLPDAQAQASAAGSSLHLDTATRTEVRLYRDRREVHLQDGQALFAVHADNDRPFHVYAGGLRITVVGTRFSVRHTRTGLGAGQTVIAVEEGRVRVARADRGEAGQEVTPVELSAGQTVAADVQGRIGHVATLAANAISPWRDGRLSFDRTPLSQAIAEFERYGRTDLVVRDPAVAALPVGGSYGLQHFARFVETLPQVLPVRLVRRGEVTEVVAR